MDPFYGESSDGAQAPAPDALWVPPESRGALRQVELFHEWEHKFVKKPDKKRGCAECGGAKGALIHHGWPPSFNAFGSGANPYVYQGLKRAWMERFDELLRWARLPKPLGHVLVEGELTFPNRIKRDQGNFRVVLEKALGDALQEGGWLENDDWDHYEFGGLAKRYEKGKAATRLILFPTWPGDGEEPPEPEPVPPGQADLGV